MANNTLQGLSEVMANLNAEVKAIKGRTKKGLIVASIIVQRSMAKESPKTPVDTRNLEASFFRVTSDGKTLGSPPSFKGEQAGELSSGHSTTVSDAITQITGKGYPALAMGFSVNYAMFVHENMDANFQRPGAGPKFFEEAIKRNQPAMLQAIIDNAKIE